MIKSLFVAALLSILIEAQKYELLVQQDSEQCHFDKVTIESTGNQGTPSDPCYSNIGTIAKIKDDYKDANGKFSFRLTYYDQNYIDKNGNSVFPNLPKDVVLVWSQTSWITDPTIVGADLSQIPTQRYDPDTLSFKYFSFHGLGSPGKYGYLDSSPGEAVTYGSCTVMKWQNGVIWGFERAFAKSNKLEILAPEKDCVLNTNEICSGIELNTDRIDSANGRIDTMDGALNTRIDTVNGRIDTLRDYLQATPDAAHAFNGDVIPDNKSIPDDSFEFSKTELLLLGLNLITIVFGLFICWRGGLFSKNNKRGYAKVRQYYESDAVEKPINA